MIRLEAGGATAEIARDGAELRQWTVAGAPLIWSPDPSVWADTAPILFPVVGWTRGGEIRVEDRRYPLGLHGFARHRRFEVREQWPDHVRLALTDDAATRALYPFPFRLEVHFTLSADGLETVLLVDNPDDGPLPYACGLHPGFRWPLAGGAAEDYEIVFEGREASHVPEISSDGLFTPRSRRIPLDGRHLPLSPALMAREALCFLDARSRALRYKHRSSGAALDIVLEDFPHIALWSRPPAPFLCIEAWTGRGDDVDACGDIFQKPSMRLLPPGAQARHSAKFSFSPPHLLSGRDRLAEGGKPDR